MLRYLFDESVMKDPESFLKKLGDVTDKTRWIQKELNQIKGKGIAAGGLVEIEVDGQPAVTACKIDPALFKECDHELLEELVTVATNAAFVNWRNNHEDYLRNIGDKIPTLNDIVQQVMAK
jgi:DNA-binding YbaB/EbfC family protein